ncbi:MAG TPA: valine--tRNA ligase [Candidatus Eisenbacteria bacterium]|nr:valine--tRNA ligase [Candidatus Eisenbacteria bacterium]
MSAQPPVPPAPAPSQDEISKVYNPKLVEKTWYQFWLKKGYFKASSKSRKKPYTIVIPPPNVTGILHMGHGLNNTLQDILTRFKRMQGYETLWMPGTDHAGIATQNVVEKSLREEGLTRHSLGREKFVERVWKWREKYGNTIIRQLHRLGSSCDWDRTRFTMDEGLSRAVREVFVRLYEKGLIYRGKYIINWCPRCQTALSDEEAQHKEITGHLYHLKYMIEGTDEHVTIATTRPETMLGDTAIGFHPSDDRYKHLAGKTAILPLLNRRLRIIQDETIDPKFGTGALKITPAHDPVDFQLAQKHGLDFVNIMNPDATLNENAGPYKGLDRFEARKKIIAELEDRRILLETKEHLHSVGHCYRCQTVIEPYLSPQWFVHMKPLAKPAIAAVKDGRTEFVPKRWTKVYLDWMTNIKDWCVSRQIWWGHRIPVWYCPPCRAKSPVPDGKKYVPGTRYTEPGMIVAREAPTRCPDCGNKDLIQDEDVLDTWFSSWLWPFSTLGWPDKNPDLKFFYPTSTLVTGYEIIFFWVARMMMAGIEFMGKEPFKQVYIHGIVRDETGAKMSKSLGNAVDPIDIIDEYGADALRYGIISITAEGQDVYASKEKFEVGRNFANKIWNAARFVLMNLDTKSINLKKAPRLSSLSPVDRWILSRMNRTIEDITGCLDRSRFNEALQVLYDFFWHQFCDWYLELTKPNIQSKETQWVLATVLDNTLKLMHPFMPFVTEEIWQKVPHEGESIMVAPWPKVNKRQIDRKVEAELELILGEIQAIRNVRSAWQINPKESVTVAVKASRDRELKVLQKYSTYVVQMAKVSSLQIGKHVTRPKESAVANIGRVETYVVLSGLIDVAVERQRIEAALEEVEKMMRALEGRLKNEEFVKKAPKEIVEKERRRAEELDNRKRRLEENLRTLA